MFFRKQQSAKLVKLNERLTTLQSQQQPISRPSLHRQLPPTIPSRHSPLPTWSNQEFQEPDFSRNNLPSTISDRPRLKDYLAAMKPDTWGSGTGRPSKRSSMKREENMYIPPPLSNIPDNSNFYTNTTPSANHLYSSVPSTAGSTLTSLPAFSPRHYPVQAPIYSEQHSLSYQQPASNQLRSNDPAPTILGQSAGNQPQMIYNSSNTQPFPQHHSSQPNYQHNPSPQQAFHQQPPSQPSFRQPSPTQHPGHQPSPPPQPAYQPPQPQQPVYQPPPPQQSIYQPPQAQQPVYQPPPPQQPTYQPPPPQQQAYQPFQPQQPIYQPPPQQQSMYQPQQPVYQPPSPQQPVYQPPPPQQPVYQPPPPQQPVYQPPPSQQPMYQSPSMQQPTHQSFIQQPAAQYQINQQHTVQPTQVNPIQQPSHQPNLQKPLPQTKFDPYRPQPVGAYDIPKPQNQPMGSPAPPPPQQQQTIPTQPRVTPQDVYRPGGLLTTNPPSVPSLSTNNNNYDPNQYVQYVPTSPPPPPPPPLVPSSVPSPPAKLPVNVVSTQPSMPNILDDLLSLALEQQVDSSTIDTEPNSPEPQSPVSNDEELQVKSNGKPIACIQPLSMLTEEKQLVQPMVTPGASLSPPQDPYNDKDKLDQLISDVQRFEKHVSTMTKKTLNGTIPLEVEWKVRIAL